MKKTLLLLTLLGLSTAVMADPYSRCIGCHGLNGQKKALGKSKIISHMTKADIVLTLTQYKNGKGNSRMMKGQAASLSKSDIHYIADKIGN